MRDDMKGYRLDLPSLKKMKGVYDSPVVILGGGSTLSDDLFRSPRNPVLISVNHHFELLRMKPDFAVFADKQYDLSGIKRLSIWQDYSDFNIDVEPFYDGMSLTLAIWFGCHLTTGNVYLCGVDCFTSIPTHYSGIHDEVEYSKPTEDQIRPILNTLDNVEEKSRVIALQPPLKGLW